MTLHDKLKEIIDRHNYNLFMNTGIPYKDTISAIIQAVEERLPQGIYTKAPELDIHDLMYACGWNAYREEVRKVLSPIEIDTGDGFKPVSVDRGSFFEIDYKELLRKYMDYIVFAEGTNYVTSCDRRHTGSPDFTEQEWHELERMAVELGK